jgi:nuclear transport factor 2 (NTF2) superfamily protein
MELPLAPPFTLHTALAKVQRAQDLWNTRDPDLVSLAYTLDSEWRNRDLFLRGRGAIVAFLAQKWQAEREYKLKKRLFCFSDDKIAVEFEYEFVDEGGAWWRAYGIEHWTFDPSGLMRRRDMSANNVRITAEERMFR